MEKVKVTGKAQNRTSLGIMHAYMAMFPQATLEDLRKAFPNNLNPDKGVSEIFVDAEEQKKQSGNWNGYFTDEECLLHLQNGQKVSVVSMWTKPSFERLVEWAKQYDIVVDKYEAADKGFGKKGGYQLEFLNGYVPPMSQDTASVQKNSKWWIWVLVIVVIAVLLSLVMCNRKKTEPEVITVVQTDTVKVVERDTVYIQQFEEIEKNFNAAHFAKDSYELNDDAKFALYDLVKLLEKNPTVKLRIVGHTSEEGDPTHNQKLLENRAKAAVEFLVSKGIDASRLEYEGKGGSEPIDPNNQELNRRTEFQIIEQ